jgi:hypothetical protein
VSKGREKSKGGGIDEFTRLAGCHRKPAIRVLNGKPVREILFPVGGKPVKLKPEKKRPACRGGANRRETVETPGLPHSHSRHKNGDCLRTSGPIRTEKQRLCQELCRLPPL